MSHHTIKTAALGLALALAAGAGAAQAAHYGPSYRADDRAYQDRQQGYDAAGRPYGHQDDEIHALQYMFPQTYGWPRGTDNQF
jgi:hypothetical protein